ncbi:MAG: hypothetical protein U9N30_10805, partial [Campylobacterota bacterium]|nr:hypothetical protein [Campylobacterota bacterium]
MKYLIQSLILSSIVVVFTACTPKITVKTLNAPKVIDINTKQMAIVTFNNDNAGQTQAIESQLNSVYFNGIKYYTLINQHNIDTIIHEKKLNNQDGFRLYSGSTEAKSILTGQIDFNTTSYTKYHKEIKDYDYCLRFKGDKKDRQYPKQIHEKSSKQTQCIKYAIQYVPCKKQQYDLQTTLKLINIEDSKILLSKTYVESSTHNKCRDDRRILPHLAQENTHLANAIAKRFVRDITPTYSYHNIDIIEEVELTLNENQ